MSTPAASGDDRKSRITPLAENAGEVVKSIPVRMSYEIIKLFSEGLYQSPHKAVEELVANAYDAGAKERLGLYCEETSIPKIRSGSLTTVLEWTATNSKSCGTLRIPISRSIQKPASMVGSRLDSSGSEN